MLRERGRGTWLGKPETDKDGPRDMIPEVRDMLPQSAGTCSRSPDMPRADRHCPNAFRLSSLPMRANCAGDRGEWTCLPMRGRQTWWPVPILLGTRAERPVLAEPYCARASYV